MQPSHTKATPTPKAWAVYSAAKPGLGIHTDIAMMPVDGGGQVLFDKLWTAEVTGVSMDWNAETLAYTTYTGYPSFSSHVYVLQTGKNSLVDNRPIHIAKRAVRLGNITIQQPGSQGDACALFVAPAVIQPPFPTLPGFCGEIELDPNTMFPLYLGVVSGGTPITTPIQIPNDPLLQNAAVYYQGARAPTTGTGDLSRVVRLRVF